MRKSALANFLPFIPNMKGVKCINPGTSWETMQNEERADFYWWQRQHASHMPNQTEAQIMGVINVHFFLFLIKLRVMKHLDVMK